mmetsp:Transcript_17001/g.32446  ORF Transcript_17001/g.32446 Transcript_17001/m.32446 type:complete len:126 (+) Transcript_17001:1393-1770(+)
MKFKAKKWGNCHKNKADPNNIASGSITDPPAAVHPMTGGTAPTTAPTQVFHSDLGFMCVYNPAYNPMFPTPKRVVTGSVPQASNAPPAPPAKHPNPAACSGETTPVTKGRCAVRFIRLSLSASKT